jgi:hypothetical protein
MIKENRQHKCARLIFQLKGTQLARPLSPTESARLERLKEWMSLPPWTEEEFELYNRIVATHNGLEKSA